MKPKEDLDLSKLLVHYEYFPIISFAQEVLILRTLREQCRYVVSTCGVGYLSDPL